MPDLSTPAPRDSSCNDLLLLPKSHPTHPGHLIMIEGFFFGDAAGVSVIGRQKGPHRQRFSLAWLELTFAELDQMRHRPAHRTPTLH